MTVCNRKVLELTLVAAAFAGRGLAAASPPAPNPMADAPEISVSTSWPQVPWPGETLEYELYWGFISVGTADMAVRNTVMVAGRPAYHIVSTARSSSFIDKFYKVRDLNESWLDAISLLSLGYSKKLREGSFFRDEWVKFDHNNLTFSAQEVNRNNNAETFRGKLPGPVQDMLSSLYFIRTKPLEVGKDLIFDVNTKKNWPLVVKVLKRETVKTPAGKFDCFLVEPGLREEGIFVAKGKSMQVWLTADGRYVPVMMKAEVFIGHVSARLVSNRRK